MRCANIAAVRAANGNMENAVSLYHHVRASIISSRGHDHSRVLPSPTTTIPSALARVAESAASWSSCSMYLRTALNTPMLCHYQHTYTHKVRHHACEEVNSTWHCRTNLGDLLGVWVELVVEQRRGALQLAHELIQVAQRHLRLLLLCVFTIERRRGRTGRGRVPARDVALWLHRLCCLLVNQLLLRDWTFLLVNEDSRSSDLRATSCDLSGDKDRRSCHIGTIDMANMLLAVFLLLLLYVVTAQSEAASGHSEEETERRRWAVDAFFTLQSAIDGERVHVELRHACGAPVNATAASFW